MVHEALLGIVQHSALLIATIVIVSRQLSLRVILYIGITPKKYFYTVPTKTKAEHMKFLQVFRIRIH
jgi:hypothetical protein